MFQPMSTLTYIPERDGHILASQKSKRAIMSDSIIIKRSIKVKKSVSLVPILNTYT